MTNQLEEQILKENIFFWYESVIFVIFLYNDNINFALKWSCFSFLCKLISLMLLYKAI